MISNWRDEVWFLDTEVLPHDWRDEVWFFVFSIKVTVHTDI